MDEWENFIKYGGGVLLCGTVGGLAAWNAKKPPLTGILLGGFLGPLGCLIVVIYYLSIPKPKPATCSKCKRSVSDGIAHCPGCGSVVPIGIGISGFVLRGGVIHIKSVARNGGAAKAGIGEHDKIVAIDGQPTSAMTQGEAISKIRGLAETDVILRVRREAGDVDVPVTRLLPLVGIGVTLSPQWDGLLISKVERGGGADVAGISARDGLRIIAIDGDPTGPLPPQAAADKLLGRYGTSVVLRLRTHRGEVDMTVTRGGTVEAART